ncbi:hypothetical protein FOXG_22311 [Fusarium oxysporum f. sp. lycopersici 4287]|uniref:Uncharacterized protein n=1 Tax=Fusarium oxysporum f. sp. lycopersici (strain 4287 / CBS 123668 / FGSC 9935 / NRRL 34936) TaxID=426428 RepID=A0A0J9W7B6_FUSO4|nr:hypothetical protein FOXG_22311 [Fusarium oxysporum f. sp. lycopersici 4287]KNB18630.1 hypothetical protein FOXG_22311 [Fusarium oxysporum f. sp. lycopersici 4287]
MPYDISLSARIRSVEILQVSSTLFDTSGRRCRSVPLILSTSHRVLPCLRRSRYFSADIDIRLMYTPPCEIAKGKHRNSSNRASTLASLKVDGSSLATARSVVASSITIDRTSIPRRDPTSVPAIRASRLVHNTVPCDVQGTYLYRFWFSFDPSPLNCRPTPNNLRLSALSRTSSHFGRLSISLRTASSRSVPSSCSSTPSFLPIVL